MRRIGIALALLGVTACSWVMVRPAPQGERGPRVVCTTSRVYQRIDAVLAAELAVGAAGLGTALAFGNDSDPGLDETARGAFAIAAASAIAFGWSGYDGMRDTDACRAALSARPM